MIRRRKRQILEFLAEFGKVSAAILFPKSLSFGKYKMAGALRKLAGVDNATNKQELYRRKNVLYVILHQLKKDGLVARVKSEGRDVWRLTEKGEGILRNETSKKLLPDGKIRLFIFDIPEREKRHRNWLRGKLRSYGYEPLQKSVWWSNRPLPQEFIEELEGFDLTEYIHIFGLGEKGTLKEFKIG